MLITCGTCNGDGFVSFGDRHVENRKEVCSECKGLCMVEARTGEVPQASASPDGTGLYAATTPQDMRALGISPLPGGGFSVADPALDPLMSIAKAINPEAFVWSDNADAIKQARQAALEAARRVLHVQALAAKPPVAETPATPPVWSYEFSELGGYDSCSSGYVVYENGEGRIVVDVANMPDFDRKAGWDEAHRRYDSAEALAQCIVRALNAETPPSKLGD